MCFLFVIIKRIFLALKLSFKLVLSKLSDLFGEIIVAARWAGVFHHLMGL